MSQRPPWWVGTVLVLAVAAAFAWFIWPTPWEYPTPDLRRNRLTGAYEMRDGVKWTRAEQFFTVVPKRP